MKDLALEKLLNTEMENIKGGADDTKECRCDSGAAAVIIIVQPGKRPGAGQHFHTFRLPHLPD